jgi:hypothetical protein
MVGEISECLGSTVMTVLAAVVPCAKAAGMQPSDATHKIAIHPAAEIFRRIFILLPLSVAPLQSTRKRGALLQRGKLLLALIRV